MNTITNSNPKGLTTYLNSTTKIVGFIAILYFFLAKLSLSIFITQVNLPPFFPAVGFGTAAVLIFGRKAIFGVALGSFIFSLDLYQSQILREVNHQSFINVWLLCFLRPLTNTLNIIFVSYFTLLWCKTNNPFNKAKHILYFTLACLLGSILAPTICTAILFTTSYYSTNALLLLWSNLIRGNALGIMLFTPFVLSWLLNQSRNSSKYTLLKKIELFILPLIAIALSIYVFETTTRNESLLYLLLIWVAYRFDFRLITMVTSIIAVISIYYTTQKVGTFVFDGWNNNFFMLQIFLFVNMVSILFLKAILTEKENEKIKLQISEQDLGLEKTILKATIEYSNDISIFSLDTKLNYLSFNTTHENYMKNHHGATIKIGDNHIALISWENKKADFTSIYQHILKGNIYSKEEKDPAGDYWKISKSPIMDKKNEIIGVTTIITNITELKLKEIQLEKNNLALNERIKEQKCLFDISKILSNKSLSITEKLTNCAKVIPSALQFSEIGNCKIHFLEQDHFSDNYHKNDCQINQKLIINDTESGFIEIGYFDTKNQKKEVVFLEEEIKLLETVSDIISESLQTKIAEEKLTKSEDSYRHLFENIQDVFFKTSVKTKEIVDVSPSCTTFNGITREELIGQNMAIIYTDQNKAQMMFQKIITEHKIVDHNNEITIKGKSFYVSINAKIIFDSNGAPEYAIGSMRDITTRRLTEENLKISEEKFRNIYESSDDIYFKKNLHGLLLDVSPSIEKHFDIKREAAIGLNAFDFYVDRAEGERFYKTLLKNKKVLDYEERYRSAKGEINYFSVNARVINDSNGQPAYFEGTMRNVNERILNRQKLQKASDEIKKSEEKFRSIYENMQDVYYLHSLDGTILDLSPSVEKHFKEKRENIIGMKVKDLYNVPDKFKELSIKINKAGFINDQEIEFVTPTGETLFFSINSKLINDENGQPTLVEGTMRNINDRIVNQKKLLEVAENLKISEAKFRSIYENLEDIYFRTTMTGAIIDVSPSFEKHFKKPSSQALEGTVLDLYYDEKDRETLLNRLKENIQVNDFDARFKDNDGNIIFFSVNARIIYDEEGNPLYIEGSMRNINDRIAIQKEMIVKNRKLEFQNTELEQFAYIASHDLQEPLITVIQCIGLLQEGLGENLDEDQKQYLQFINSSTSRMQVLVKGLLDYSRIGKERKTNKINCNEIVEDVLADMAGSLNESNAVVEYENLPTIESNTTEMRQLFQNLISNANKFRKKGQRPKIKIGAVKEDNNWLFSIQDNGIGIAEHDIEKAFEIFKRLNNREEYQGTGIGLSHCKKIIEQHRGKIWVESKYNEGSTFKWMLPIEQSL